MARSQLAKSNNCDDDDDTTLGQSGDASPGRRPCAVYDFEAAVGPSVVVKRGQFLSSQPLSPAVSGTKDQFQSTLDGLCQHIIVRLLTLIRYEEALQSENIANAKVCDSRVSCAISAIESIHSNNVS